MQFKSSILALGLAIATSGACFAVPYVDIQHPGVKITTSSPYANVFNLVNPGSSTYSISGYSSGNGTFSDSGGYVIGTELASATASFYFSDDDDSSSEKVDVFIGLWDGIYNTQLINRGKTTVSFGASWISLEILETFGAINYVVTADSGDVYLKYAMLTATPKTTTSVPDGATTVTLLGGALLALAALRRKLRA